MNKIKQTLSTYICNKDTLKAKIDSRILEKRKLNFNFFRTAVVSVLLLLAIGGRLYYNSAVSYVSIDINPSIMLTANAFDKVLEVKALNNDADEVLADVDVINMNVSKAVNEIVKHATIRGYINQDDEENAILITTYCNNDKKQEKLRMKIHNDVEEVLSNKGIKSAVIDQALTISNLESNNYGVSQGKMVLVQEIIEENPDLEFDELIKLPMRDIVKYTDIDKTNTNSQSNGNKNQGLRKPNSNN